MNICLHFGGNIDWIIEYLDSNQAIDLDKRISLIGYVFTIEGCAIRWKATLQNTVALSTMEVENMAITEVCMNTMWLKGLIGEIVKT